MSRIMIGTVLAALPFLVAPAPAQAAGGHTVATAKKWVTTISGSFGPLGQPDWWYRKATSTGNTPTVHWRGTILGRGGLKVTVYECKFIGVKANSPADLRLIYQATLNTNGQTLSYYARQNYYYYLKFTPQDSGRTGNYTSY